MSRKGNTPTRELLPDPKHGSQVIARFINMVMKSGKKSVAEGIVYGAIEQIGQKSAAQSRSAKKRTAWRMPTRRSHTTAGNEICGCRPHLGGPIRKI